MQIRNLQKPGSLVLPDGTAIKPGESAELSPEFAENAGVKEWVASGIALILSDEELAAEAKAAEKAAKAAAKGE